MEHVLENRTFRREHRAHGENAEHMRGDKEHMGGNMDHTGEDMEHM